MKKHQHTIAWLVGLALALALSLSPGAHANPIQDAYRAAARRENPAFKDFSATAGRKFYTTRVGELACSSCHTDSPMEEGRQVNTNIVISPMAPAANPDRLTDAATVEKWFRRDCIDVLTRACTAQEKGDFMAYLLSR